MPRIDTSQHGTVEYSDEAVLEFPEGMPAFEDDTRFVLIEKPDTAPLIFLQSLVHPALCFLTAPVHTIDASYQLKAPPDELAAAGIETSPLADLLCLAVLTIPEDRQPTANMMAPVVIDRGSRRAKQVIQYESGYSFAYPLVSQPVTEQEDPCSS